MKRKGLRIAHLGFAVVAQDRLAILVSDGRPGVIVGGVELDAIGGTVAGVVDLQQLACLGYCARAHLDVLVTQGDRKYRLLDSLVHGNAGGRFDVPRNERIDWRRRLGRGDSRLGRGNAEGRFGGAGWNWRQGRLGCARGCGRWNSSELRLRRDAGGWLGWGIGLRCGRCRRRRRSCSGSLGAGGCHGCRQGQNQNCVFHCVVKLRNSSSGECIRRSRPRASGWLLQAAASIPV